MRSLDLRAFPAVWRARPRVVAWALPILFTAVYALALLRPFPVLVWHSQDGYMGMDRMAEGNGYVAGAWLATTAVALLLLAEAMRRLAPSLPRPSSIALIVAGWLGASLVLLFVYPGQSSDIFDYIFRAHMLGHLGQNPLTIPPSEVIQRAEFPYLAWHWEVDYYGPLWHALAVVTHLAVGEGLLPNILAFKILGLVGMAAVGALIYALLRRLAPEQAEAGLALWLWNPLVLNESVMNAHNEVVMVIPIVAGLWLLLRRRPMAGLVLLFAAGLVKLTAWLLVPVALVWLLRQYGLRKAALYGLVGGLLGLALIWSAYAPLGGLERIAATVQNRGWWPAMTWTAALFYTLRDGYGWEHDDTRRYVIGAANVLFALVTTLVVVRVRDLRLAAWGVALTYLLIGAHWFQPWYALTLVALTPIAARPALTRYTVILSLFMLLHPIALQFFIAPLKLDAAQAYATIAALTLLTPQLLALDLIRRSVVKPPLIREINLTHPP